MLMSETTVRELKIMINNLSEKVVDGFIQNEKQHNRLTEHAEHANGSIGDNTKHRFITYGAMSVISAVLLPTAFIVLSKYV